MASPEIYQKNIQSLAKYNLEVARRIDEASLDSRFKPYQEEGKSPSISFSPSPDQEIFLHSKYNPEREAKKLVEGYKISQNSNIAVLGFGCGYHLLELAKEDRDPDFILITEKNPAVIKLAFQLLDFTSLIEKEGVLWLLGNDFVNIQMLLKDKAFSLLSNGLTIVLHPASVQIEAVFYEAVKKGISDFYLYAKVNINTQVEKAKSFVGNAFQNLMEFIKARPVKDLFGIAKGLPVFIVSAGPSLDKTAHLLKEVKNKGYIIAVDSAAKTLLNHGIRPDFVVSIDFTPHAEKYFRGLETKDLSLVFDLEIYPEILRTFKGRKYAIQLPKKSVSEFVKRIIGDKGEIEKGLSVSHSAVLLAKKMEAEQIILVGQDLAYPREQWHTKGSSFYQTLEVSNEKELHLCDAEDIFGGEIKSSAPFMVFKSHFEKLMQELKIPCFDATEGGLRIQGTEVISMQEALIRFCHSDKTKFENPMTENENFLSEFELLDNCFRKTHQELEKLNHQAYEIAQILIQAENKFKATKDRFFLVDIFKNVKVISEKMDEYPDLLELLKDNATEAIVIRSKKTHHKYLDLSTVPDDEVFRRIRKEGMFFGVIVNASDFVSRQIANFLNANKKEELVLV